MAEYITTNEAQTQAIGEKLGKNAKPGQVFALDGDLGAGKTVMTRGIARGMGLNEDDVCSPTFTIVNEYDENKDGSRAQVPLFHFDTYRLGGSDDFLDAGLDEYFDRGGVCVIEWSSVIDDLLPKDTVRITITGSGEMRKIEVT
ncbi:MAG: tRNA (adenosine(37)-N6)-threonylcarbamoyltransferase complex ATPase subunit type 1 TsaE [Clostridiales bacterium]|jgi:tRNA threonylcarbamoyladenosine biosynthesis protein TsaE|nr:tRNA (adenosine(37)-N6)-threonylcarbamoyltransferase complex ATPase subunit type 1 TsaE [Clostridiales bacterium]MBR4493088.1 tRNA (adenosine(37)-N6)-threonylcarbamoyltransferase complex ATPase subunit type 1 TsaE [Clostridiales bacterium]